MLQVVLHEVEEIDVIKDVDAHDVNDENDEMVAVFRHSLHDDEDDEQCEIEVTDVVSIDEIEVHELVVVSLEAYNDILDDEDDEHIETLIVERLLEWHDVDEEIDEDALLDVMQHDVDDEDDELQIVDVLDENDEMVLLFFVIILMVQIEFHAHHLDDVNILVENIQYIASVMSEVMYFVLHLVNSDLYSNLIYHALWMKMRKKMRWWKKEINHK